MPTWSEILRELAETKEHPGALPCFDEVRRKYLAQVHQYTKRNVILYASSWVQKANEVPSSFVSINDEDMLAFMEVINDLESDELDLIIHSPGGSPESAEAIVLFIRSRFKYIRVIVPQFAMSAATLISCAADEIVMGDHSFLGPIDPQILLPTPLGLRWVPAQSILDQFDQAKKECTDSDQSHVWLPMLNQFGPDLLVRCKSALDMSKELVKTWLQKYMFKKCEDSLEKSEDISKWLSGHENFKSHSRKIPHNEAERHKLQITRLEKDAVLQDLILSVFYAVTHVFSRTPVIKIVENHIGKSYIKRIPPKHPPPPNNPSFS